MEAKDCLNLIQLVQKNPCIWDRTHPLHSCARHNKSVWIQIAEELNCSVDKTRIKWKNLRDSYRLQLYKKIDALEKGDPKAADMIWPYFNEMSFLQEHMYRKAFLKMKNDIKIEKTLNTKINDDNIRHIEMVTVDEFDQSVLDYLDESTSSSGTSKKNPIAINVNPRLSMESVEDEDRCFFDSLLPYMKLLSPKDKMLCRMRIQEVIFSKAFPSERDRNGCQPGNEY